MGDRVPARVCARLRRTACLRVSLSALLALPAATHAQSPRALIVGRVVEQGTDRPIGSATIRLLPDPRPAAQASGRTAESDENGRFVFDTVAPGRYTLAVEHLAYAAVEDTVHIREGGVTYDAVIQLAMDAIALDPIAVVVRDDHGAHTDVRDRIRRMRSLGLGDFFDRQQIEASGAQRLTHLVARLPGVSIRPLRNRAAASELRLHPRNDCAPSLYVDGMQLPVDGGSVDDIVGIRDIEFVEVYRRLSELPGEFADERALRCGAIAVWVSRGTEYGERWGWHRMLAAGAFAFIAFVIFRRGF